MTGGRIRSRLCLKLKITGLNVEKGLHGSRQIWAAEEQRTAEQKTAS